MVSNSKMCFENSEASLFDQWFLDLAHVSDRYREPVLSVKTVKLVKEICDAFQQNTHVFVLSVEVFENYYLAKISKQEVIEDPLLAAVTTTFICHKCDGAAEGLKIKHVVDLMFHFTQECYSPNKILEMESEIFATLNWKLPLTSSLDDMDVIINRYVSEAKLIEIIRPLCLRILEFVYIERQFWFKQMKDIYSQNKDCVIVFQHLISSRFFLPLGVIITAIELTHCKNIINVDTILQSVTKYTHIHSDHIKLLTSEIKEILSFE